MNKISATGRLAADAELKYTQNGDPILQFRLASDVGFGEKKITNWFRCNMWGKRAESLAPHLTKGLPVTVWGVLELRPWKNKEGQEQISPDIRVDEIELHGTKPAEQSRPAQPAAKKAGFDDMDDDIPF